jgi:hypothetical protein
MKRTCSTMLVVGLATIIFGLEPNAAFQAPLAAPDIVSAWNEISEKAIVANGPPGQPQILYYAMVHAAIYDAVNSIDRRHEPYIGFVAATAGASRRAAVAASAHRVLVTLFLNRTDIVTFLDDAYSHSLASISDESQASIQDGVSVGEEAAAALLAARVNDGRCCLVQSYTPPAGPGSWKPAPDNPNGGQAVVPGLADVTPFTISSPDDFLPDGPPPLSSDKWAKEFNEVKLIGALNSSVRTAEQSEIALFWTDNASAMWNRTLRSIADATTLSLSEKARLFAIVNMTAADGQIIAWYTKFRSPYQGFWRPITAIREGDTDGNPMTAADPDWLPFVRTPAFPEYTSGHTTFSSALTEAIALFFRTEKIQVSIFSNVTQTTHTFRKLSDAVKEIVDARIYSGIHYRSGDLHGMAQGRRIARNASRHYLR